MSFAARSRGSMGETDGHLQNAKRRQRDGSEHAESRQIIEREELRDEQSLHAKKQEPGGLSTGKEQSIEPGKILSQGAPAKRVPAELGPDPDCHDQVPEKHYEKRKPRPVNARSHHHERSQEEKVVGALVQRKREQELSHSSVMGGGQESRAASNDGWKEDSEQ
jgi:hypothetical protein